MNTPDDATTADRAEALLGEWPAPERSAVEWEDAANLVMNRVRETTLGSTPDDLLAPPLAPEPGEPSLAVSKDEPKLADIARAAIAEGALAANEIARDSLLAAEQGRREPSPGWHDPPRSARGAVAAGLQGRVVAKPSPWHEAHAHSDLPNGHRDGGGPGFGAGLVGGAVLALAASAALYVSMRHHDAERVLAAASAETRRAVEAPAAPITAPTASALALEDLPEPSRKAAGKHDTTANLGKDALSFRVQSAPKEKLVLEESSDDAPPVPQPVAAATPTPKAAVPPTPAAAVGESQPSQPSLGAVQAAVGSVMAGARSCLTGQDEGSKTSITFGSNGRVKSVGISGPAAGTPAESCLRSALMAAQVPPFSEASYSASLTIRPP